MKTSCILPRPEMNFLRKSIRYTGSIAWDSFTKVVSKMGILPQSDHNCNATLSNSKIPDYAREYRNEYLFIRGINKVCENFVEILGREEIDRLMRYFNRFLKAQQLDYLSDTSEINFKYEDVKSIESLELQLNDYMNLYYDPDRCKFDEEKSNNVENDFPGFKRFFECFRRFNDKINVDSS